MTLMRKLLPLLCLALCALASCEENVHEEDSEFADWRARNEQYMADVMAQASAAIATAKQQYGDAWEDHCEWRIIRHFAQTPDAPAKNADSICVQIVERGTGSGCPYFTDSVQLNYLKRLIPSASYPEGRVLDHSGYTVYRDDIFNMENGALTKKAVNCKSSSSTLPGESTAFMQMHIGDRWLIYIPQSMAYGSTATTTLPAYSAVVVEARLRGYYRAGTPVGAWR